METEKRKKGDGVNKYILLIEIAAVLILTVSFYLFTKDIWILLLGGIILISIIIYSLFERRKYERELEEVTEYIDQVLTGNIIESNKSVSDKINSKLNHQLAKLQGMVNAYSENAKKDKQEIRDLIVEIAHQLRMPIANIDTYLQLLQEENLDMEERKKYLNAIDISKNKLIFLVESFIKMSRLESNVIQIRKESTDLNKTIETEMTHVYDKANKKDISIIYDNSGNISVFHDKNWLGEAIYNLLDNSIKYSPSESDINISVTKNDMFTEIRIQNEGNALPAEDEQNIFKRFYRGTNVKDQDGFGLGLYLTREIVLKHHGFIKYKNIDDNHIFSIFLPA